MSYKTILVHLNDHQRAEQLLRTSILLSRSFEAHLIGLVVHPVFRMSTPVPMPYASELAARARARITDEQNRIKESFDRLTSNQSISVEWCTDLAQGRTPASAILEHNIGVDLTIVSQPNRAWDMSDILDVPDELALGSGGPVLVVPLGWTSAELPKTITCAWNGKRESARAIRDAQPLLRKAQRVVLVTVGDDTAVGAEVSVERVAASLARHGIKSEISHVPAREFSTVGESLRSYAIEIGSEILVMGCYGHSRLRELAFGGVTRHILREMTIPVMFSH